MNEKNYFNETSQTYYVILCKHVVLFGRGEKPPRNLPKQT